MAQLSYFIGGEGFLIRALLAGIIIACVSGPVGCFVVWRRLAYFGDTVAHAGLLGVALAIALQIDPALGAFAIASLIGVAIALVGGKLYGADTLLGVLAHGGLAAGLVGLVLIKPARLDIMAFLLGDILSVTIADLAVAAIGGGLVLGVLIWRWKPFLLSTIDQDLARVDGYNPVKESIILSCAIALLVAMAMKLVGVLLITALLIIPAAAARTMSKTPEVMAWIAAAIGAISVVAGMMMSIAIDTPTGPSVVVVAVLIFTLASSWWYGRNYYRNPIDDTPKVEDSSR